MNPKERLLHLEARSDRLADIVCGLAERRLEARAAMQRAAGGAQRLERPSRAADDNTALLEARRLGAESEESFKRLDAEWSRESRRLADAQALASRCRAWAEEQGIVERERGMRRSAGGSA